jgi:hypothetical protein
MEETVDKETPSKGGAVPPPAEPPPSHKDMGTEDETSNGSAPVDGSPSVELAPGLFPLVPVKKKRSQTRTRDEGSSRWKAPVLEAGSGVAVSVEVKMEVASDEESAEPRPSERRLAKPGSTINGKGPLQVCSICGFKSRHGPALTAHQKGHKNERGPRPEKRKHKLLADVDRALEAERSEKGKSSKGGVRSEESGAAGESEGEEEGEEVTQGGGKSEAAAKGSNYCNICKKRFKNDKALFGHKGRVHSNHKQELEAQERAQEGGGRKVRRRVGEGKVRKKVSNEEGKGSEEYVSAEEIEFSGDGEESPAEENEQMEMLQAAEVLMAVGFFNREDEKKEPWKKENTDQVKGEKTKEGEGGGRDQEGGGAENKSAPQDKGTVAAEPVEEEGTAKQVAPEKEDGPVEQGKSTLNEKAESVQDKKEPVMGVEVDMTPEKGGEDKEQKVVDIAAGDGEDGTAKEAAKGEATEPASEAKEPAKDKELGGLPAKESMEGVPNVAENKGAESGEAAEKGAGTSKAEPGLEKIDIPGPSTTREPEVEAPAQATPPISQPPAPVETAAPAPEEGTTTPALEGVKAPIEEDAPATTVIKEAKTAGQETPGSERKKAASEPLEEMEEPSTTGGGVVEPVKVSPAKEATAKEEVKPTPDDMEIEVEEVSPFASMESDEKADFEEAPVAGGQVGAPVGATAEPAIAVQEKALEERQEERRGERAAERRVTAGGLAGGAKEEDTPPEQVGTGKDRPHVCLAKSILVGVTCLN